MSDLTLADYRNAARASARQVDALYQRIRELEAALREVCDELDYYGDQAGEYFREKGGCDETLAKARALLPAQDRK